MKTNVMIKDDENVYGKGRKKSSKISK